MNICFIMYPWNRIEPETDSTISLIYEATLRDHTVAMTTVSNMTIRNNVTSAFCNVLKKGEISTSIPTFHKKASFNRVSLPLSGFDTIFVRDNPPLDNTVLNFLDSVKGDTFIINAVEGLRIANNKLYTASLDDSQQSFIPVTHVSKNKEYLERVFSESNDDKMIMKPLRGYGGQGVIVVEKRAQQNFRSLLEFYVGADESANYVILQEYIEGAQEGDIRIMMLNGEAIGAMRRVPNKDDVRSNIHAGGIAVKHTLTRQEKALCKHIGPKLVRDGLYFVGLDVIQGKLLEVNALSPGGIRRINKLNRVKLQKQVIDFVEHVVLAKEIEINKKNEYRKIIQNAHAL